jgi:hypothetical protein
VAPLIIRSLKILGNHDWVKHGTSWFNLQVLEETLSLYFAKASKILLTRYLFTEEEVNPSTLASSNIIHKTTG